MNFEIDFTELCSAVAHAAAFEIWLGRRSDRDLTIMRAAIAKRERRARRNKALRTKAKTR